MSLRIVMETVLSRTKENKQ